MSVKKQRRLGNPARRAEVDAKVQAQLVAVQAAAVSAAAQRKTEAGCVGCCD